LMVWKSHFLFIILFEHMYPYWLYFDVQII
jgi:hypothetical protein